jgi:hypothetical protein
MEGFKQYTFGRHSAAGTAGLSANRSAPAQMRVRGSFGSRQPNRDEGRDEADEASASRLVQRNMELETVVRGLHGVFREVGGPAERETSPSRLDEVTGERAVVAGDDDSAHLLGENLLATGGGENAGGGVERGGHVVGGHGSILCWMDCFGSKAVERFGIHETKLAAIGTSTQTTWYLCYFFLPPYK